MWERAAPSHIWIEYNLGFRGFQVMPQRLDKQRKQFRLGRDVQLRVQMPAVHLHRVRRDMQALGLALDENPRSTRLPASSERGTPGMGSIVVIIATGNQDLPPADYARKGLPLSSTLQMVNNAH